MELTLDEVAPLHADALDEERKAVIERVAHEPAIPEVVIGRRPTAVKILFRLRLQKFVPSVVPQPLVRVEYRDFKKKMTTRMPEHFLKNFYVKCSELF